MFTECPMIRILSETYIHPKELEILIWLLDSGLDYYHFRKEHVEKKVLVQFLETIPEPYRNRVVLHHDLMIDGFLRHHKSTERSKHQNIHSCSVHTYAEAEIYVTCYDHIFWSPVFDSISKPGYSKNSGICVHKISPEYQSRLIALGGIEPLKFAQIKHMGFSQIAVKGWFWNQKDYKQAWRKIQTTWQE